MENVIEIRYYLSQTPYPAADEALTSNHLTNNTYML